MRELAGRAHNCADQSGLFQGIFHERGSHLQHQLRFDCRRLRSPANVG